MPELVEVECARKLSGKIVGKPIDDVWVEDRDFKVFSFPNADLAKDHTSFADYLRGCIVTEASRKGKQMVLHLHKEGKETPSYLFLHLGMSGTVCVEGEKHLQYKAFDVEYSGKEWPPAYIKMQLTCGGVRWAFCDIRRFGKVFLTDNLEELDKMAPDALMELPEVERFLEIFGEQDKAVKTVLLDQNLLLSGLGNWTADEALYQSAMHPETRASLLPEGDIVRLRDSIKFVLETAVERNGEDLPSNWLFEYRWGKDKGHRQVDFMGREITHIKSGGRTSAVVLDVQKKLEGSQKRKAHSNLITYRKRLTAEKDAARQAERLAVFQAESAQLQHDAQLVGNGDTGSLTAALGGEAHDM